MMMTTVLTTNHPNGLRRDANNVCFNTGLDLCTSTNPYVGDDCGYGRDGVIDKKKNNAKCPKCLCQIIVLDYKKNGWNADKDVRGMKVCGIGKNDNNCNPSANLP